MVKKGFALSLEIVFFLVISACASTDSWYHLGSQRQEGDELLLGGDNSVKRTNPLIHIE